jgi:hypothetical protein
VKGIANTNAPKNGATANPPSTANVIAVLRAKIFARTLAVPMSTEPTARARCPNRYTVLRTARYNYVEYATGERELYDLSAYPTELTNIYDSASQMLISDLHARLAELKVCKRADTSATSCKTAEGR